MWTQWTSGPDTAQDCCETVVVILEQAGDLAPGMHQVRAAIAMGAGGGANGRAQQLVAGDLIGKENRAEEIGGGAKAAQFVGPTLVDAVVDRRRLRRQVLVDMLALHKTHRDRRELGL